MSRRSTLIEILRPIKATNGGTASKYQIGSRDAVLHKYASSSVGADDKVYLSHQSAQEPRLFFFYIFISSCFLVTAFALSGVGSIGLRHFL